jgi:hypothetical protein
LETHRACGRDRGVAAAADAAGIRIDPDACGARHRKPARSCRDFDFLAQEICGLVEAGGDESGVGILYEFSGI